MEVCSPLNSRLDVTSLEFIMLFFGDLRVGFLLGISKRFFWWNHVCPDATTSHKDRERFPGHKLSLCLDLVQFSFVWFAFLWEKIDPSTSSVTHIQGKVEKQSCSLVLFILGLLSRQKSQVIC